MNKHIKLLLGGSPCTHWSIAQKNNRETEPSGLGWELFKNFLIAKEKFKPDYFLYENNKSMAPAIREQITKEFGVKPILINSALVSAQNRQRLYWTNIPGVAQPEDRGILLKDILESGLDLTQNEKSYALTTRCQGAIPDDTIQKHRHSMVAEPIALNDVNGKSGTIRATCYKDGIRNLVANDVDRRTCVAEPVIFQEPHGYNKGGIKYDKSPTMTTAAWEQNNKVVEPIRVGSLPKPNGELSTSQGMRIYSVDGKAVTQSAQGGGLGAKTGLYACPVGEELVPYTEKKIEQIVKKYGYLPQYFNPYNKAEITDKTPTLTAQGNSQTKSSTVMVVESNGGFSATAVAEKVEKKQPKIYEVQNGLITIKDNQYPIKLPDGYYIIRKLTVKECMRLQTIPEWYQMPCSNSQNYKMLGNGWTIEVIKHILSYIPNIQNCTVEVLSMYDGMSCGQITLTELGCQVERYVSYEIDKYAIQTTQANFPKTEQRGDAFQLRNTNWSF